MHFVPVQIIRIKNAVTNIGFDTECALERGCVPVRLAGIRKRKGQSGGEKEQDKKQLIKINRWGGK